ATTFRLTGDLDIHALQAALNALVARHEVLRTTYSLAGDSAVQVIHPARGLPLPLVDVPGDTPEARQVELIRMCQEHALLPFDLEKVVIRARLLRVEPKVHVLAMVLHHSVSDAWCTMVLARELTVLYATLSAGMESPLPPLPIQYADYAVWQRDWLEGGVLEEQVSWWKQRLMGAPALEMPTDRPRPAVQSFAGSVYRFQFPSDVAEPLLALSRKQGATSFMVMMALFQTLLSRYSGQTDFVVGTPIAGRTRPEVEGLLGCFLNTLAFRSRLEGSPSFNELLVRVRTQALEAYARQDAPFEKILDTLQLPRDLSRTPLFQAILNVLNTPEAKAQLPSLELSPVEVPMDAAKFDLGLEIWEHRTGLSCRFEYSTALYDEATIVRMSEHLIGIAREAVAAPDVPLAHLPLLNPAERQRILVDWNATRGEYPREACIQDLFVAQAAKRPDAVALEFGDTRLTYAELDAVTNQWAHLLRKQGVGPDVLVAVCLDRSIELIVSLLAILKAGGAYLPLDAAYPAQRLAAMLEDAPPRLLLTTRVVRAGLSVDDALPSLFVEELHLEEEPTSPVHAGTHARHLAYVDFTSGSTGRPKGVAVEHRGVLRLLHNAPYAHLGPDETFLLIAPISFDASTLEVWAPLLFGGRLVVFPPRSPSDLDLLAHVLQHHRITTLHLTAGLFAQVVDLKAEALKGVRQVLTGGDVVSAPHVRRVVQELGIPVTACYGPTETTLFASTHRMSNVAQVGKSIPIGRPIADTQLYVLDAHGQPVPAGVPGELFIGGDGLARGYLSRPDLTAERFVPNAFSTTPGERLYRTGDLARWKPDGVMEFLGRADNQVKVRGYRIELAEVEAALRAHPEIRAAVALVREDVPGDKRLVVYFVASQDLDPVELRKFLLQRLPEYMLPSAFVPLAALPLTANAKVDRKALPAPEGLRTTKREYVAPRTDMEQRLATVWAQVLRVERVGVDDNFFELGGDSIISLQVIARARQAGVQFSVRDIFQNPTLGALATKARVSAGSLAEQGPVVGEVPLTPIQLELLERDPEHAHHANQPLLLRARQPLQATYLEQALQLLISHHDALRLRFTREDASWRQRNASPEDSPFQLLQVDLSALPPEARPGVMEEQANRLQAGFDLGRSPLVRAALFHFGPQEDQRLLIVIHHLVVDAVSWRVLIEDLEGAYLQLLAKRPPVLPGKTTSFLSWARRLGNHALSDALHAQTALWLDDARKDVAPLPVDASGPNTHGSQRSLFVDLNAEETRLLLQETPAGWRAQINDVLLTALALALREWTGQSLALVDLEGHGREELFADADVSRTVGWFTSVTPALLRLPISGTHGDSLRAVRDSLSQWTDHGIGYGLLRFMGPRELRERMAAFPQAQVSFNYLGQLDGASAASTLFALSNESIGTSVDPRSLRPHLLLVTGSVQEGQLRMGFGYSHHLHHASTIETLAQRFLASLRTLIAQRHSEDSRRRTPGDFPLARITQPALDGLMASQGTGIEDLYPLSALQQGMLFHSLYEPDGAFYFEQRSWSIHSDVDIELFRKTWQAVVDRNPVLRTSFVWKDLEAPLQVVHAHALLPFEQQDLRHLSPEEQQVRLSQLKEAERTRGFDVARAPLMRMLGVRLSDTHWRFVWSHHHLLLDGWSSGLFFQEVFALYDAFHAGRTPPPSTRPPFRDYIAWLQKTDAAEDEAFWRGQLQGLTAPTPLPAEQPATAAQAGESTHLSSHWHFLPPETTTALQAFVRQHQLTLNTLAQAAWALVLARYAGTQDVLFGTTLAGRPPELEGSDAMLGLLITTLPIRIRLPDEHAPVLPWLQSLQAQQLGVQQHQHTPLVTTMGWSDMPRGTALFNSLLVFENFPLDESLLKRSTALDIRDLQSGESSHYALTASVMPGNRTQMHLAYDSHRFSLESIRRLLVHWTQALVSLTQPEARLADVSLLSPAERQQVLVEWNTAPGGYPDVRIHDLFEQQADLRPDAIALEFADTRLSYAQLDARANQLAHLLREQGVGPDSLVALCLERSVELIVSLLAILKAGGAYVPLDASYPAQRLAAMLEDAPPQVLITSRALRTTLPVSPEVPCLLVEDLRLDEQSSSRPVTATLPRHLAYVDFTSGSTGRPKGVAVEHRGVLRLLHNAPYAKLGPDETFLLIAPISFDASTLEVWGPLLFGGRLVVFPPVPPTDLDLLAHVLQHHRVTTLHLTAGLFAQVVDLKAEALKGVRQVLTGGDVVSAPHVRRVVQELGIPVTACYGPTETTLFASTHRMTDAAQVGNTIPIGRPIADTQLYVLDANGQPVPPGIPGELFIGGDGLARGYLSRPNLTAERFVPNAFSTTPGERLYRTGDLARWKPDGVMEFLGRADNQVKVRGYRIELAEVEAALRAHADVREVVAVVREDVPGEKRLVAYVVLHQDAEPAVLRTFLAQRLPEYMLPSAFVPLAALPLTANAKVDRKALPAPEGLRTTKREYVAPRTDMEQRLATVLAQVLRVERIGVEDNFFELGGDSIISLQVVARARQVGVQLSVRDLFQHPTLGALATVARESTVSLAEQGPVVGEVPLTPIQLELLERDPEHAHHFNQPLLLRARQPLQAGPLEEALRLLLAHHDALRLGFSRDTEHGDAWRQRDAALDEAPMELLQVDLSALPAADRLSAMEAQAVRLQSGFDLAQPPLVRAALFHFGPDEAQRLLLVVHHLVVDTVSWRVLIEDLEAAYQQLIAGKKPALPAKTTSFQAWARKLEAHALSDTLAVQTRLWLDEARLDIAPLPVDLAGRNTFDSSRSVAVRLELDETRLLLQETPAGWRARINDVLLTALALALREWTGQSRTLIDLEGHGREELFADADVSRTVGWFTTVTPALVKLPEGGSSGDSLRAVRDSLRKWPHHGLGYGLLRFMGPPDVRERMAAFPQAQVAFNYLGQLDGASAATTLFSLSDEAVGMPVVAHAPRPHALLVNSSVRDGRLQLDFVYSDKLHHASTIEAMAQHFLASLRTLIAQRHSEDARQMSTGDFPLARLAPASLNALLASQGPSVEDLYPLSPLQQGMLFHALYEPDSAFYFEQRSWSIHSAVDIDVFRKTWQAVVDRNPILRTSFVWKDLDAPLQVVHAHAPLPFEQHDWRHLSEEEQKARLERLLVEDRERGFDLARAPLMRLTAMRASDTTWRFIWSHHHLLLDGWSSGLFFQEVFALYDAFSNGTTPVLPTRPPYREYIAWLQRTDAAADEAFWRGYLSGLGTPTPLPAALPAVADASAADPRSLEVALSVETTSTLQAFVRQHQLTLNTLVQAAWALVLARYAGTQDVLFGTTLAGRPPELEGSEAMLGLLITTLPVRIQLPDANAPLLPWLQSLQEQQLGIQKHQQTPLVTVQSWSDIPRGTPLFNTLLVYENFPVDEGVLKRSTALDLRDLTTGESTHYALSASAIPGGNQLRLNLAYEARRFEPGAIQRMLGHWTQALESLTQTDARLSDLTLVTREERARLVGELSGDVLEFERDATLHGLIEAQVAHTPDADAVVFEDTTLSFRQLDTRANQLARHLKSLGVGPDVTVGLCLERSAEAIVALLAVLKAGGGFVPLDPSAPAARKSFLLKDCGASVLLTSRAIADAWKPDVAHVVRLDSEQDRALVASLSGAAPASAVRPESLAYVIYTSGSTGTPKGVMVQHRSVLNLHRSLTRTIYAGLPRGQRITVNAPLYFDASIEQVLQLLDGHCLVVVPEDVRLDPERMLPWLEARRVDALDCTPSQLKLLLAAGLLERAHVPALLSVGGEALDEVMWRQLAATTRTRAFNGYGPTECTVDATTFPLQGATQTVPVIGRPVHNLRAYVLDERQRLVAFGMPGELCFSGEGVARGYLGRPDLTAERFLPDPFSPEPGARLYRTGDKARWREDGTLEFMGRLDFQVKVRGFRIELGEIEATLRSHPGIRDAVALVREDVPGDARLVAYVAPEVDTSPLREHLRKHLPDYMVPAALVALPVLPLTPNGKVDRKALPAPEASQLGASTYVAPQTPTEVALATLWSELLRVPAVGRHDNFFELGGHSLLATQVVSRIRSTLGVELPLGDLFSAPTVAELAARLVHAARAKTPPLTRADRTSAPPLSFAQQRLWFIDQLEPGTTLYNMPLPLRFTGAVDEGALRKSLDALMARHEVLRTTFRVEAGQPVQHIHAGATVPFESVDLTDIADATERQAEAKRRAIAESRRPFNLEQGPVIRALLLKLDAQEHVLVLHLHHIVSDGWSLGVLVREMTALYEAFRHGQTPSLPELPVQYADFSVWQRGWLQGDVLEAQLGWWKQQLAGAPHALDLPIDKPRPAVATQRGGAVPVHLPSALAEKVEALAQREGATPFMVLLAAFQTVLHRYSGQDDVLVGSPIANRRHAETEGLIGFFVNTLVLRGSFSARPSFRQLVAQVRTTTLGAYEHQDIPFERLVESLQTTRDLSRTPLFQVMFALQNAPLPELVLPGLSVKAADIGGRGTSQFELSLDLNREADGFVGLIDYATDLFERSTVERLIQHLRVLLESALERPDAPLADLSFVGTEERQRLLGDLGGTVADFDRESTLHGRIEAQAARTPNSDAVSFEGTTLSFRLLDARANQLARHLRSLGVGPEVTVGLCLERSVESIVALLAVLKAGGAFVPLDPAAPAARRSFILGDSGAAVLLTTRTLADAWRPDVGTVVCLDGEQKPWAELSPEALASNAGPEHLAYVLYTSGSTGMPKGVAVQHRSVLHLHQAMSRDIYVQPQRGLRVSVNAPLFFDASMEQLIQLMDGYCLCLVPDDTRKDPEAMLTWLEAQLIDSLDCTPSQLKLLLGAGLLERAHVPALIIVGGEALDEVTWRRLSTTKRTRAFNVYGPTETTVNATSWAIQDASQSLPVIGRPLDNVRVYILDGQQRLVPFGMQGELCLAGEGLARGYLGRPDLTAERFVPHPFSTEPGARLYRTGDKARWREDGTLDFMGRLDFQVKLRGYRIELGEIEATLRSHPGIRDAVALVREDVPGDARLVAYVAPEVETATLRDHLRKHLPEYMVPAAFMALPVLPLTPNGKVDRKALPVPEASQLGTRTYQAPETPTEIALAALWSEVLRIPTVGRHDNFFELGGHSLLATQLVSRVRAHFGVELPLRAFFERPTVAALAALIDSYQGPDGTGASLPPLVRAERPDVLPLSFAQQRLWFIEQLGSAGTAYSLPIALKLEGTLDTIVLLAAFDELVRRHEALRTTFHSEGGAPSQIIHPPYPMPLRHVDLTVLASRDERDAEANRLALEEARAPFDLEHGPLFRALLLKLAPKEYVLVLNTHHIISDGWSAGVLVREMGALYAAFSEGLPSPLPELAVQVADHSLWQRDWLQGDVLEKQLGYWREQLEGAEPYLDLPTDFTRPAQQSFQAADEHLVLSRELTDALETLAKQESATPYMVLLSAFKLMLHRYSGQEDVLIGSPIAGRRHAEAEALIGYFANTVVLRTQVKDTLTFRELLAQVRGTTLGAYEHQDLPFEKLVEALKPDRDLSRTPFFQVTFTLQNSPMPELVLPELTLRGLDNDPGTILFDLQLVMNRGPDGFTGGLLYNTSLFSQHTAAGMAQRLVLLLEAAVRAPDTRLSDLPLLTPEERRQVLVEWNRTSRDYPRDASVAGLFSAQAARTPDATALKSGDKTLTYAALDRASNQLAHHLRKQGVRPGDRVGLCLERSFELIVGMLGILKAGAAYVPVEAKYPADRITWMLQEAGVSVLVT
ncbi:MAG: amino acid adenylation domain-containing protein, partial [Myxococcaceae bacterium]